VLVFAPQKPSLKKKEPLTVKKTRVPFKIAKAFLVLQRVAGIISNHDADIGEMTLYSLNNSYEDYAVNLEDVITLFNAIGIKRSNRR
jgi:hypothetical protein